MKNIFIILIVFSLIGCKSFNKTKEITPVYNFEYMISFDELPTGWIKSINKSDYQDKVESIYLLNGDSIENAKADIAIVHCGFKGVSAEEFCNYEMNYLRNRYQSMNINFTMKKWNPFVNINFPNTFQAYPVHYILSATNIYINIKVLYIRLNYDFYIINFKSPNPDLISDNALMNFYKSLNFDLVNPDNYIVDYDINENNFKENWKLVYYQEENSNKLYEFIKKEDKLNDWKQMIHLINFKSEKIIEFTDLEKFIKNKIKMHKNMSKKINYKITDNNKENNLIKYLIISHDFKDDNTSEIEVGILEGIGNNYIMKLFLEKGKEINEDEMNRRLNIIENIIYK